MTEESYQGSEGEATILPETETQENPSDADSVTEPTFAQKQATAAARVQTPLTLEERVCNLEKLAGLKSYKE